MTNPLATWIFDALPPSGTRRGGDPSQHVFKPDLETFVREVVQNANDQRRGNAPPEVRFSFEELSGTRLQDFFEAMEWRSLEPHLQGAARMRGGRNLKSALEDLEGSGKLLLVRIEDRNTVGLTGDEFKGENHFRALCKDTLFSHKQSGAAGGSYGLGKSVLWAFSGFSTVLFNSVLSEPPAGRASPRLIGRVELPSHGTQGGDWYTGSGWFGATGEDSEGRRRAESLWSVKAAHLARDLHMARERSNTGTSLLIVGFREPASDEEPSVQAIRTRMARAALLNFWPAMVMPNRSLRIAIDQDAPIAPGKSSELEPFVQCYRRALAPEQRLDSPGDVVCRELQLEIPAHKDGAKGVVATVRLAVRLDEERSTSILRGHVASFRGPGMVVKYWDRSGIAPPGRPFHAVLACGEARDPENVTELDRQVERFLRLAEPPGHDEWGSTSALKEEYRRGYAKALEQLKDQVTQALRELLAQSVAEGVRGPERLQRRFPIGAKGPSGGSAPSAFRFGGLSAHLERGSWRFSGVIQPARSGRAFEATIRLREVGDAQTPLAEVPIRSLEILGKGTVHRIERGVALISVPKGLDGIGFSGTSVPAAEGGFGAGELRMEITSELGSGRG